MPSITTHYIFAKEVLKKASKNIQKNIKGSEDIYYTFAQSHDYLYYYTFNIFNKKKINKLGHTAHRQKTQDYILNIIKEIIKNHLENNKQVVAYLYGIITHYCLDTTCHPFIFYKTGVWRKNKETAKYRGEHNHMERDLDSITYEKYTNKKYNQCNISKEIIKKPIFSKELNEIISNVYYQTYNIKNVSKYIKKGIRDAKIINSFLINDHLGIKFKIYKLIDKITKNKYGNLKSYSTYNKEINIYFLNNEHKEWNHPSFPKIKYTYSFDDLFNISINKTLKIIEEINKVLYENNEIDNLRNFIPNLDYSTGIIIEESRKMKYFAK